MAKEDSASSRSAATKTSEKSKKQNKASISETFSFAFGCGTKVKLLFALGFVGGILNGLVYPALAYLFSNSFSNILSAQDQGLGPVRDIAYTFMVVGVFALVAATVQTTCFELVAYHASQRFRLLWFKALLRQEPAYFDVNNVGGIANQVGPNANKYRRGMGRKFGEGIQFLTTGVGGVVYAFYVSWRTALVVLAILPFVSIAAYTLLQLNESKGANAAKSYKKAGGVAYSSVSAIKTVLSLNAVSEMIRQYKEATKEAYDMAVALLWKLGIANGSMLGSFLCLYFALTLYGTSLIYKDVKSTGCDPSNSVDGATECDSSGPDVFGAMLGVAFAGQGLSQFGNFGEAFATGRSAVYEALQSINRTPGAPEEIIYRDDDDINSTTHSRSGRSKHSTIGSNVDDNINSTSHSKSSDRRKTRRGDVEEGEKIIKAILPKYEIDSSSDSGLKPANIHGAISFKDVHFSYPTRPSDPVLNGVTFDIKPGETVAFVGPSGGGKSTVVSMIERFYDPKSGTIELDGVNIKDINVKYLRSLIGYVGQEPTLFATTIRGNIKYGNPDATQEQIEAAAKLANAHDFIMSFSDGYDTQVGDKGSQLSGGQKQRIAIARVLVGEPKILLLDEATSALDAESELVVQDALDSILEKKKVSTIIIAHRLSTIRNADTINVIRHGQMVESGVHDHLMAGDTYYRKLVEKQEGSHSEGIQSASPSQSRTSSAVDLQKLEQDAAAQMNASRSAPHIEFKQVTFSYPARPTKKVFDGFNLTIHQGETVALVGPSGGGKSTTVGLIERFYDPSEGVIEYMGSDLRSLNVAWYRDQIGYVGQEPTLFNDTIARNIAYGAPGATQAEIEEACRMANCHDFITEFPEGYETLVGERGTQLSGGQKQRVAIARALIKKPEVLILDEATSALDNESEAIVQAAIDGIMQSRGHTVILIAHRLSTIRNADKIAVIADGKVLEYGSHDELLSKSHGRYRRLFDSSLRSASAITMNLLGGDLKKVDEAPEEEAIDWDKLNAEEEAMAFNVSRARAMAKNGFGYMLIGAVGALMAGAVFPVWGFVFSELIDLLFRPVYPCTDETALADFGYDTCEEYWDSVASSMRTRSFTVAGYWLALVAACVLGFLLTVVGFGMAAERINIKIRDDAFTSLLRQEMAYFDRRSVGSITSQLQDDASRIQAFSGEPIRAFLIAVSGVVIGVVLSFVFMWPFALLAIGCIPLMGAATATEMKQMLGEDIGNLDSADELNSPGGIIVETLLNMRTVSALTLEDRRYDDYEQALRNSEKSYFLESFQNGFMSGMSMFVQQWVNALQIWFGGYLLFTQPENYSFRDFLIADFALLFALFGLGAAFQDISDRKEVEKSAGRVFYLLDRKSEIDPLSDDGKKAI